MCCVEIHYCFCNVLSPCFGHAREKAWNFFQSTIEQLHTLFQSCHTIALWSVVSKRGTHLVDSVSYPGVDSKSKLRNHVSFAVLRTLNLQSVNIVLCIFSIVSVVANLIGHPEPPNLSGHPPVSLVVVRASYLILQSSHQFILEFWLAWWAHLFHFFFLSDCGCLLSMTVEHNVNSAACLKFDRSQLTYGWREHWYFGVEKRQT